MDFSWRDEGESPADGNVFDGSRDQNQYDDKSLGTSTTEENDPVYGLFRGDMEGDEQREDSSSLQGLTSMDFWQDRNNDRHMFETDQQHSQAATRRALDSLLAARRPYSPEKTSMTPETMLAFDDFVSGDSFG